MSHYHSVQLFESHSGWTNEENMAVRDGFIFFCTSHTSESLIQANIPGDNEKHLRKIIFHHNGFYVIVGLLLLVYTLTGHFIRYTLLSS